jgi:hypothetical protein
MGHDKVVFAPLLGVAAVGGTRVIVVTVDGLNARTSANLTGADFGTNITVVAFSAVL